MLKKILIASVILLSIFTLSTKFVLAADADPSITYTLENPIGEESIFGVINRILDLMFKVAIYAAVLFILYAGWIFITAQGDSGKTKTAVDVIKYVLIGVVIMLLAKGLVSVTYYIVTGKTLNIFKSSSIKSPDSGDSNNGSVYTPSSGGNSDAPVINLDLNSFSQ